MRLLALAIALFICTTAQAQERLPNLSLEGARALLAQHGVQLGAEFSIGPYRFKVSRLESRTVQPGLFDLRIGVEPIGVQPR